MARYSERDRAPVDGIVDRWREDCLIHDGSLLYAGEHIWTPELVEELYGHFNLDLQADHERSFEEKFEAQLSDASRSAGRLAAELVAAYLLFAANAINGPRKRELLSTILSWKGDTLDEDSELARAMDSGIGNPGQFFNNGRPYLVMYLVAFAKRVKALDEEKRRALLADPWDFKTWLAEDDDGEHMMRHILLHLLFPDEFERIASGTHKYRIRDQLIGLVEDPAQAADGARQETDEDIDRQLLAIREKIAELLPDGQHADGQIDFYYSPLREAWDPGNLDEDDVGAGISNLDALEFYVVDGRPRYCYNLLGVQRFYVGADREIPAGTHQVRMEFDYAGPEFGKGGTVSLFVDGEKVGEGTVAATAAMIFSADDTCDIGKEGGAPVAEDYPIPNNFTGEIDWVEIDVGGAAKDADHRLDPEEVLRVARARQ